MASNNSSGDSREVFTQEMLIQCLYGRNTVRGVELRRVQDVTGRANLPPTHAGPLEPQTKSNTSSYLELQRKEMTASREDTSSCSSTSPVQDSVTEKATAMSPLNKYRSETNNNETRINESCGRRDKLSSRAFTSFPQEVQLCTSSLPGYVFGVRTTIGIPQGTIIGPYEGKRIRPDELERAFDSSYMWEIFENDMLSFYVDAEDENSSSWMRFIRCARHAAEQNLVSFQRQGEIFYRATRNITAGEELLVWYDATYPQYMGIPVANVHRVTKEVPETSTSSLTSERGNFLSSNYEFGPVSADSQTAKIDIGYHTHLSKQRSLNSQVDISSSRKVHRYPMSSHSTTSLRRTSEWSLKTTSDTFETTSVSEEYSGLHSERSVLSFGPSPLKRSTLCDSSLKVQIQTNEENRGLHSEKTVFSFGPSPSKRSKLCDSSLAETQVQTNPDNFRKLTIGRAFPSPPRKISESSSTASSLQEEKIISDDEDVGRSSQEVKENEEKESGVLTSGSPTEEVSIWKCAQCEKTFNQKQTLQMHKCPRVAKKPYQCGHCTEAFTNPSDLRGHVVSHVNERPFRCGFCARAFAGSTTLNNHIRMHTGEKPFNCQRCGVMFAQAACHARHVRNSRLSGKCSPVRFGTDDMAENTTSDI